MKEKSDVIKTNSQGHTCTRPQTKKKTSDELVNNIDWVGSLMAVKYNRVDPW